MFNHHLLELDEVDSTQLEAKRRCVEFEGVGVWLIESQRQTAGYGRKGTQWWSESPQNYYVTLCVKKKGKLIPGLWSLGVAARLLEVLRDLVSDPATHLFVKWPNDLCVLKDGEIQKVGGILTEVHHEWLLCGVGINLGACPPIEADFSSGVIKAGHLGLKKSLALTDVRSELSAIAQTYALGSGVLCLPEVIKAIASEMQQLPLQWYWGPPPQGVEILGVGVDTGAIHLRFGDGHVQILVNGSLYAQKNA